MSMNRNSYSAILGVLLLILLFGFSTIGCAKKESNRSTQSSAKKTIYTVNYPLAYFAVRTAGDLADVQFPAPADVDPDFWQPDQQVARRYQEADLILLNGSNYAKWTTVFSLPESRMVNTSQSFANKYMKLAEAVVHKHGPEGEHAHEGLATLTWLDPQQAREQARAARDAIIKMLPDAQAQLLDRWSELDNDLAEIENSLKALPKPANSLMLASHPVYDYLGRFCEWNLKSMHWEPNEAPSEEEWNKFAELHKSHAATIMIWEAPPLEEVRARLESEFQVTCVPFYPCGNRPETGDYLSVMRENIQRLREHLDKGT